VPIGSPLMVCLNCFPTTDDADRLSYGAQLRFGTADGVATGGDAPAAAFADPADAAGAGATVLSVARAPKSVPLATGSISTLSWGWSPYTLLVAW